MIRIVIAALAMVGALLAAKGPSADAGDGAQIWGDTDCGGAFNIGDAINTARDAVGLPFNAQQGCPGLGDLVIVDGEERIWGDTDCGGALNIGDAINISRKLINLGVNSQPGCPTLGTEVMLGAPGIVLDGTVPSSIHGEAMNVSHATGDELAALDPAWADWFPQINAQQDSFELSTSFPKEGSALDFMMIAITATNDGFDPGLADSLFAAIQDHPESGYAAENADLGDFSAQKITVPGDPNYPPTYYYGPGSSDTLWVVTSSDEGLVAEVLAALVAPAARSPITQGVPQGEDYVPGSSLLIPRLVLPVEDPVCVAEPFGRVHVQVMALDAVFQAPVPAFYTYTNIVRGELSPPANYGGAGLFDYRATNLGDGMEHIAIQAVSPAGGNGIGLVDFPVQHCLNGTWDDGGRVITVNHLLNTVTATWMSASGCHDAGGVDFSGEFITPDRFEGTLEACSPEECVDAGFLEAKVMVDYDAQVSSDGNSVDFDWESQQFDLVYDDNNNLVACNPTTLEPASFSITRLTFGPGLP